MLGSQVFWMGQILFLSRGSGQPSLPGEIWNPIQEMSLSLMETHFPAFWGKIEGFSALLNIIKKYIFNISLLLFFWIFNLIFWDHGAFFQPR